ncbi:hypothetical protein ACJMQP_03970 [Rhodopseudomonas palustris]
MTKTIRIKIVPDGRPDTVGQWVTVHVDPSKVPLQPVQRSWRELAAALAEHVPAGHRLVGVES